MVKRGRSKVAKLVNVTNRGEEKCKIIISSPCKRKLQPDQEMITKTNKNKSEAKTTSKNRDTKKNVSQNRSLENLFNWTVETLFTEAKNEPSSGRQSSFFLEDCSWQYTKFVSCFHWQSAPNKGLE